jgi:hypothetical protein
MGRLLPFKNMVQFGEEPASRLELSRIRVRGLSEFLYLYKKVENLRKPKLQATSRKFFCVQNIPQRPEYAANFAVYIRCLQRMTSWNTEI